MRATRFPRKLLPGVLAAVLATLVACSSARDETVRADGKRTPAAPAQPAGPATGPTDQKRVTDARLVAGELGWATTPTGLFVTTDAGSRWRRWTLPVPPETVLAVALLSPTQALVASNTDTTVQVSSTGDAGATWKRSDLGAVTGGPAAAEFGYEGGRVAGLLVKRASSTNFSLADWYATGDGATWARHDAPAAGHVSYSGDGTLWLAGGPAQDQLFNSSDDGATWAEVALPANVPAGMRALEAPTSRPDGLTVLPVTLGGDRTSQVVFLTTRDKGKSWKEAARAQVAASVGAGTPIPSGPAAAGNTLVVVAPDGSEVVRVPLTGGQARRIKPRGLRKGVVGVRLTSEKVGWAKSESTTCSDDKTTCTTTSELLVTRDGGDTWQPTDPSTGG